MSQTNPSSTSARTKSPNGGEKSVTQGTSLAEPRVRGDTIIDDEVVSVIARISAEQVEGVHRLGQSTLRGMLARLGRAGGVDAEVGMKEAAVDIEVVVEFGYPIHEVAAGLREQIIRVVEATTGRRVVEVNVFVVDVHVPRTETRSRRQLE